MRAAWSLSHPLDHFVDAAQQLTPLMRLRAKADGSNQHGRHVAACATYIPGLKVGTSEQMRGLRPKRAAAAATARGFWLRACDRVIDWLERRAALFPRAPDARDSEPRC
jgi:hypothetical protein